MKNKDKFLALIKEGFRLNTLKNMNESQLNVLYKKVVKEQDTTSKTEKIKNDLMMAKKTAQELSVELGEESELREDWGGSDQNIMNQSIHKELGKPEEIPSPFSSDLESAVESAVDFYWGDWEEYQTDREGLINNAKKLYLRRYFPEEFKMLLKMFEPIDVKKSYDVKIEDEIFEDQLTKTLKKSDGDDPEQNVPEDEGPSDNMNADDGMGIFEMKKKNAKMKTPISTLGMFEAKKKKKEKYNPWAVCTSSLGLEGKERKDYTKKEEEKFERCVKDVKKQNESYERNVRQIEESLISLLKNYNKPTMTKKDLLEQGTKEAPTKTPVKTPSKPDRKTPYVPKHKPAPKAGDTTTTPTKTPVKTPSKPDRKTPYVPKHKPAPKAGTELPEFLKFNNLNITFRDE
jgi:hypothetical protein